ncbi:SCO family protein [Imhoffiella purpurea]|uniref:Cytochrome oxidase biogenesis protein Sco1/SenC/PrrC, putative copper metallochaperone n=1 Tax=Imhoffiella purpurea TaxID=1249627 RepID=W9V854_9GAMM|nr:SCO family protein [Imhoffiella purpurea]EXJ15758.1 Cytochrome oxidase biogenesis protein Sco1/SenC/PrrC, putative copper metallochaperone [Imhoffiella purpurea]
MSLRRGRRLVVAVFVLLLAGCVGLWLLGGSLPERLGLGSGGLALSAQPKGGDFTLQSKNGPVRLADLRGRVVLIYFGYTACPDICPTNLAYLASALQDLTPQELDRVLVLFVSVDPERDSLDHLAAYGRYFHPNVVGITGTPDRVAHVAELYGAAYRKVPLSGSAMGYLVDHSAYTYVVDTSGRLVRRLDHATSPSRIREVIREVLAEN